MVLNTVLSLYNCSNNLPFTIVVNTAGHGSGLLLYTFLYRFICFLNIYMHCFHLETMERIVWEIVQSVQCWLHKQRDHSKLGIMHACNSSAMQLDIGGSLGLTDQPVWPNQ